MHIHRLKVKNNKQIIFKKKLYHIIISRISVIKLTKTEFVLHFNANYLYHINKILKYIISNNKSYIEKKKNGNSFKNSSKLTQ